MIGIQRGAVFPAIILDVVINVSIISGYELRYLIPCQPGDIKAPPDNKKNITGLT